MISRWQPVVWRDQLQGQIRCWPPFDLTAVEDQNGPDSVGDLGPEAPDVDLVKRLPTDLLPAR